MRKMILIILSLVMMISIIGCSDKEEKLTFKYDYLGLEMAKDGVWNEYSDNIFIDSGYIKDENSEGAGGLSMRFLSDELKSECAAIKDTNERDGKIYLESKPIFEIRLFRANKISDEDNLQIMLDNTYEKAEKVAEDNGLLYYFCEYDFDDKGLSTKSKKLYEQFYNDLDNLKASIKTFKRIMPKEKAQKITKLDFKLKDLYNKEITSKAFNDHKLTMVNIWSTFCGPCIEEMPELEELKDEFKEKGFAILGIVGDTIDEEYQVDEDNIKLAKEILTKVGVTYRNLIPDQNIKENIIVLGYPMTMFVDNKGNIIGKIISGRRNKAEYRKIILEDLNKVKEDKTID